MTPLQTTAERIEKDRVKLRVEVTEEDLKPAIAEVYRELANEMKVPGFRKGKVPRQIIDSRVGPEFVRSEALKEALPDFYREALKQEELEAITAPDIEVVEFSKGSPIVFEATVDIRPEVVVPDLGSIEVEAPDAAVTDEDIDEQMERLRDRFAELETVGREARRGDFVLIDLKGYEGDQLVDGASAPDYLYEVGSRTGPPKLDEELEGNRPGAILKFNDSIPEGELAGRELSFTVLVKEVKAKKLPVLDDEFAKTVGEFDSLEELREDLRERLVDVKRQMVEEEIRTRVLEALIDAADLDPPEKLVEAEFDHRLHHLEEDLGRAGMSIAQYAQAAEQTELELRADLRRSVSRSVVAELLLEQIAREAEIEVTEEDLGRDIAVAAARSGQDPSEVAKQLAESGRLGSVAADIMRRKALDYVVEHVNIKNRPADDESNGG
ncbi:MAG TPA: trigger factor [Actinomycetota bacterium]|nr:trigger factor [Actinomycetota bacterium]